jgi:hypothetical protein
MTVIELIDSEIKRIMDEYIEMGTKYKSPYAYDGYADLLRADGALRELEELKRKIKNDNT